MGPIMHFFLNATIISGGVLLLWKFLYTLYGKNNASKAINKQYKCKNCGIMVNPNFYSRCYLEEYESGDYGRGYTKHLYMDIVCPKCFKSISEVNSIIPKRTKIEPHERQIVKKKDLYPYLQVLFQEDIKGCNDTVIWVLFGLPLIVGIFGLFICIIAR